MILLPLHTNHPIRTTIGIAAILLLAALAASCSTTSNLPEDEQLYVGIDKISYEGTPLKQKKTTGRD